MNDRDTLDRGRTTTMEVEAPASASRIVPLSDLHTHKVASGDPDVRGWPVVAGDGRTVGRVDGLLVDTAAMRVRYLDVILDLGPAAGSATGVAEASPSPPDRVTADAPVTVGTGIVGTPGLPTYGTVSATGAMAGVPPLASEPLVQEAVAAEEARPAAPLGPAGERHVLIPVGFARLGGSEDRIFVEGLPSDEAARLPAYDGGELTREAETALLARFDRSSYDENRFYSVRGGRR
jgi:PRC-barrel domain